MMYCCWVLKFPPVYSQISGYCKRQIILQDHTCCLGQCIQQHLVGTACCSLSLYYFFNSIMGYIFSTLALVLPSYIGPPCPFFPQVTEGRTCKMGVFRQSASFSYSLALPASKVHLLMGTWTKPVDLDCVFCFIFAWVAGLPSQCQGSVYLWQSEKSTCLKPFRVLCGEAESLSLFLLHSGLTLEPPHHKGIYSSLCVETCCFSVISWARI